MARSLIQPKKQDSRKSSGVGGWRRQGRERGWTNLVREYRGEGLHKVGVVRIPLPTMFWENRPEWASK